MSRTTPTITIRRVNRKVLRQCSRRISKVWIFSSLRGKIPLYVDRSTYKIELKNFTILRAKPLSCPTDEIFVSYRPIVAGFFLIPTLVSSYSCGGQMLKYLVDNRVWYRLSVKSGGTLLRVLLRFLLSFLHVRRSFFPVRYVNILSSLHVSRSLSFKTRNIAHIYNPCASQVLNVEAGHGQYF